MCNTSEQIENKHFMPRRVRRSTPCSSPWVLKLPLVQTSVDETRPTIRADSASSRGKCWLAAAMHTIALTAWPTDSTCWGEPRAAPAAAS
eukprot:4555136-Pyramimonas_sp.AAC.1